MPPRTSSLTWLLPYSSSAMPTRRRVDRAYLLVLDPHPSHDRPSHTTHRSVDLAGGGLSGISRWDSHSEDTRRGRAGTFRRLSESGFAVHTFFSQVTAKRAPARTPRRALRRGWDLCFASVFRPRQSLRPRDAPGGGRPLLQPLS